MIAGLTQADWAYDLAPFLLSNAGTGMFSPTPADTGFSTPYLELEQWQSLLVVIGWAAVSLGGGALLMKRRDA